MFDEECVILKYNPPKKVDTDRLMDRFGIGLKNESVNPVYSRENDPPPHLVLPAELGVRT